MNDVIRGNRLLVVDDEPVICRLIRRIAERQGFEVVVADDPHSFAKTARLWRPTVVILDLKMPKVDGIQLLRELAGDKCDAHVIISSGSDARILEAAMRLGHERGLKMSGMIQKPIRVEGLKNMLAGFARVSKEVLQADLAAAIGTEQLFLEYQPKFDAARGGFAGAEALARWRHPRLGIIRPDEFIPLGEEAGLIHDLTDWVVRSAAAQVAAWRAQNMPMDVSINLSAQNIVEFDLPERLDRFCLEAGISPSAMTLELTETGAMRQAMQMRDVLTRLCLKGFKLSIDDFGTGYSSLVQLQCMPFTELKIDQSFVTQMTRDQSCRVIVEIVVSLARKLRLSTVAEGVEDAATLEALFAIGCDAAQGRYLSPPVPPDDVARLLEAQRSGSDAVGRNDRCKDGRLFNSAPMTPA